MCKICNYFCVVDCLILFLLIVYLYNYNLYFSAFHSIATVLLLSLKVVFCSHLAELIIFSGLGLSCLYKTGTYFYLKHPK